MNQALNEALKMAQLHCFMFMRRLPYKEEEEEEKRQKDHVYPANV